MEITRYVVPRLRLRVCLPLCGALLALPVLLLGQAYAAAGGAGSGQGSIADVAASIASDVLTLGHPAHLEYPKADFSIGEVPTYAVMVPGGDSAGVGVTEKDAWSERGAAVIRATLLHDGSHTVLPLAITKTAPGTFTLTVANVSTLTPGDYRLSITAKESALYTRDLTQDFSWGVLAVNMDKSVYRPGDTAALAFGVLNKVGSTICNASVQATITDPQGKATELSTRKGTIIRTRDCGGDTYTVRPDYAASYQTANSGTYHLHVVAGNGSGTHSVDDYFLVKDDPAFDVMRQSFPTRIYPAIAYPVTISVKANADYAGSVQDFVPKSFYIDHISGGGLAPDQMSLSSIRQATDPAVLAQDAKSYAGYGTPVSKLVHELVPVTTERGVRAYVAPDRANTDHTPMPIIWQVDWRKGQTYTLSYTINFPPVGIDFYELGPLVIGSVFRESRPWQIASDASKCWGGSGVGAGADWSGANWVTTGGTAGQTLTSTDVAVFDDTSATCLANTTDTPAIIDIDTNIQGVQVLNYTGTITQAAALALSTSTGYAQSAAGATFDGGTQDITDAGAFTLSAGTFRATSGMFTAQGSWTTTGGSFIANSGTIAFRGGTLTITPGSEVYNNVSFDDPCNFATYSFADNTTLTVGGTLTFTNESYCNGPVLNGTTGGIAANGDISLPWTVGGALRGTAVVTVGGTGTQTMSGVSGGVSGNAQILNVNINKPSGTLNLRNLITVTGDWTYTKGTLNTTGSTIVFSTMQSSNTGTIVPGAAVLNNVMFDDPCNFASYTIASGTLAVDGTLTFGDSTPASCHGPIVNGPGTITAEGDVVSANPAMSGAGDVAVIFAGSADQLLTQNAGDFFPTGTFTVFKTGGTVTATTGVSLSGSGQALTVSGGTFDLTGNPLTVAGALTIDGAGELDVQGAETITTGSTAIGTGSTIGYEGSGTYNSLLLGSTYYDVIFKGTGSWTLASPLTVGNTFTILSGTVNAAGQAIAVTGDWSNTGTFTSGNNMVTLNGLNQTISGATTFYDLAKTSSATATLAFQAAKTQTITHALTLAGAAGSPLSLRSTVPGTQWKIDPQDARTLAYLDVADSDNTNAVFINALGTNSVSSGDNTNWDFNAPGASSAFGQTSVVSGGYIRSSQPAFSFTATDPDMGEQVGYEFQLADTSDFAAPIIDYASALSAQGVQIFTVGQLAGGGNYGAGAAGQTLPEGAYYWRVKTTDAEGLASVYAAAAAGGIAFRIDLTPPTAPGVPTTASPTSATHQQWLWAAATDVASGIHNYQWRVVSASGLLVMDGVSDTPSATTTLPAGSWVFYVWATDTAGNGSAEVSGRLTVEAAAAATSAPVATPAPTTTAKSEVIPVPSVALHILIVDVAGHPLPSITVMLHSTPLTAVTDGQGIATFNNVAVGAHTVSFVYQGQAVSRSITVRAAEHDQTVRVTAPASTPAAHPAYAAIAVVTVPAVLGLGAAVVAIVRRPRARAAN